MPSLDEFDDSVELANYVMAAVVETADGPWAPALLPPVGHRSGCTCPDPDPICKHLGALLLSWVALLETSPDMLMHWIGPPGEASRFRPLPTPPKFADGDDSDSDRDDFWEIPRRDWVESLGLGREDLAQGLPTSVDSMLREFPMAETRVGPRTLREVLEEMYEELAGV